jgi:hypothetical protein
MMTHNENFSSNSGLTVDETVSVVHRTFVSSVEYSDTWRKLITTVLEMKVNKYQKNVNYRDGQTTVMLMCLCPLTSFTC